MVSILPVETINPHTLSPISPFISHPLIMAMVAQYLSCPKDHFVFQQAMAHTITAQFICANILEMQIDFLSFMALDSSSLNLNPLNFHAIVAYKWTFERLIGRCLHLKRLSIFNSFRDLHLSSPRAKDALPIVYAYEHDPDEEHECNSDFEVDFEIVEKEISDQDDLPETMENFVVQVLESLPELTSLTYHQIEPCTRAIQLVSAVVSPMEQKRPISLNALTHLDYQPCYFKNYTESAISGQFIAPNLSHLKWSSVLSHDMALFTNEDKIFGKMFGQFPRLETLQFIDCLVNITLGKPIPFGSSRLKVLPKCVEKNPCLVNLALVVYKCEFLAKWTLASESIKPW